MKNLKLAASSIVVLFGLCAYAQAAEGTKTKSHEVFHGSAENPPSRQYYCYLQKDYGGGSEGIKNPACNEAYIDAGNENWERERLFNYWSAYSQNLASSQTPDQPKDLVPDGELCSAGKPEFYSINMKSESWYTTTLEVQEEGRVQLDYIASQMHDNSEFRAFLTDQDNLNWEALKELTDIKVNEVPDTKGPGRYYLDAKLPEDYSVGNKSVLFIMWERSNDPAHETFFSCSDVILENPQG